MLVWPWGLLAILVILHYMGRPGFAEALASDRNTNLSIALVGASSALLGLVIATLAILVAFPDRPAANTLRTFTGWRTLQYILLLTAFNLLVLLLDTVLAIATDGFWIRDTMVAFGSASAVGLLLAGSLFGLVLLNLAAAEVRQN